jgi:hypothetical protein
VAICFIAVLFAGALPRVAPSMQTLAGWWRISDEVMATEYARFQGLRLEYRVKFRQEGVWLFGQGEKVAEDGRPLPASRRKPISIVGSVAGSSVTASLFEEGHRRTSAGEFRWTVSDDGGRLVGTFESDAAGSRGMSVGRRLRAP